MSNSNFKVRLSGPGVPHIQTKGQLAAFFATGGGGTGNVQGPGMSTPLSVPTFADTTGTVLLDNPMVTIDNGTLCAPELCLLGDTGNRVLITLNPAQPTSDITYIMPDTLGNAGDVLTLSPTTSGQLVWSSDLNCISPLGLCSGSCSLTGVNEVTVSAGSGFVKVGGTVTEVTFAQTALNITTPGLHYIIYSHPAGIIDSLSPALAPTQFDICKAYVNTQGANPIDFIQHTPEQALQLASQLEEISRTCIGPLYGNGNVGTLINGSSASTNTLSISAGTYCFGSSTYTADGGDPLTTQVAPAPPAGYTSLIYSLNNSPNYALNDPAITGLPNIPLFWGDSVTAITPFNSAVGGYGVGDIIVHSLYVVNGSNTQNQYWILVLANQMPSTTATSPDRPPFLDCNAVKVMDIEIEITATGSPDTYSWTLNDTRPMVGSSSTTIVGGGGTFDHDLLFNRNLNNAHPQYLLKAGDSMTGTLDMTTNNIDNIGLINSCGANPGELLVGNGTTMICLPPGNDNQVLTIVGGTAVWQDPIDPTSGVSFFEDFLGIPQSNLWRISDVPSGGTLSTRVTQGTLFGPTDNAQGVANFNLTGGAGQSNFASLIGNISMRGGVGEIIWSGRVRFDILSAVGNEYYIFVGLGNIPDKAGAGGTDQTNGVGFLYRNPALGANWFTETVAGGTSTRIDSGVAVTNTATAGWIKLEVVMNPAATSVQFFINGALVNTHVANIPSLFSQTFSPLLFIEKQSGNATRVMNVDFFTLQLNLTTPR